MLRSTLVANVIRDTVVLIALKRNALLVMIFLVVLARHKDVIALDEVSAITLWGFANATRGTMETDVNIRLSSAKRGMSFKR
jgi:hypothetical protein